MPSRLSFAFLVCAVLSQACGGSEAVVLADTSAAKAAATIDCTLPADAWSGSPTGGAMIGDWGWESNSLDQCDSWSYRDDVPHGQPDSTQVALVTTPRRIGNRAARFTVAPGDHDTSRPTIHLECHTGPTAMNHAGDDTYYAYSFLLPAGWSFEGQHIIQQFHGFNGGNPQFMASVQASKSATVATMRVISKGGLQSWPNGVGVKPWSSADEQSGYFDVAIGSWNDIVMHFIWDTDDDGRIEIWHRSEEHAQFVKVIDWRKATLKYGPETTGNYREPEDAMSVTRFGLYVGDVDTPRTLYHDGFRMARSLDTVAAAFGCTPSGSICVPGGAIACCENDDCASGESCTDTVCVGAPKAPTYMAPKLRTAAVIDGALDEYNGVASLTLAVGTGATGVYRLAWDDDALYVAGAIEDATLDAVSANRDGNLYLDDSLELALDVAHDGGANLGANDFKFVVSLSNMQLDLRGDQSSAWNGAWESAVTVNGTTGNNDDSDIGYTVEMRIPWGELGMSTIEVGRRLGMEVKANDLAAGEASYSTWANVNGGSVNDPGGWGELVLAAALGTDDDLDDGALPDTNDDAIADAQDVPHDVDSCSAIGDGVWLLLSAIVPTTTRYVQRRRWLARARHIALTPW